MRWILAVFVLIAAGTGDPAAAHSRSESFSSWEIDGRKVRVTFTVQSREVTRIPWQEELAPDLALRVPLLRCRLAVHEALLCRTSAVFVALEVGTGLSMYLNLHFSKLSFWSN